MKKYISDHLVELPKQLYRYRSSGTSHFFDEIEHAFEKQELFCVPIDGQNDPFDSRPVFRDVPLKEINELLKLTNKNREPVVSEEWLRDNFGDTKERRKIAKKFRPGLFAAKWYLKAMRDQVEGFRARAKISCLSERWDSILMWSHYTGSHQGVCIEYEVGKPNHQTVDKMPFPVRYVDERSEVDTFDYMSLERAPKVEEDHKELMVQRAQRCINALLFEKSKDWAYEKEWRVQSLSEEGPGYRRFEILKPSRIIVGNNCPSGTIKRLRDIVPSEIEMMRIELDDSRYALVMREL